jgi:hypothetical protein
VVKSEWLVVEKWVIRILTKVFETDECGDSSKLTELSAALIFAVQVVGTIWDFLISKQAYRDAERRAMLWPTSIGR